MAPITRSSRCPSADKENISSQLTNKAGVAIRSPMKKKRLKIRSAKPSFILATAKNETITCGITEKKKLQDRFDKRYALQDLAIYTDAQGKPPPEITKAKNMAKKTKSSPKTLKRSSSVKRATPGATPAKKKYFSKFSIMTRSKSKKGHAKIIGSAVKPKLTVKHASESASEDDLTEHKVSPEDVAQATRPSTESAKYTELPSSKDNHHSLGSELPQSSNQVSQERNAYQQPTGSSGVPQGSIQGPPISKSPACFELNVLLQGLQDVKWTPSKPIKDIDARGDIMTMKDYAKDFYAYLQMVEKKCVCPTDYLCSPEPGMPTSSMRSVLLDWLMQVQAHLNLKDETLHLAARLIDKFQTKHPIDLDRFQLVGVGCLLLAAKYEERFAPEVALLVYLTDNSYTRQDIINMESLVWKTLNFDLCWPTTMTFLRRVLQVIAVNKEITCSFMAVKTLSSYLVDLALLSNSMASFYPSETAAAAVRLALYVLCPDVPDVWNMTLTHYSNYTERQLSACISSFAELVTKGARSRCQAPAKKHGKSYESAKLIKHLPDSPIIMEFLNNETAV